MTFKQDKTTTSNSVIHQSSGFLSSITSLFWSRSSEFLSESPAVKDFPWLRLVILRAERRSYEEENNLIGSLELKIYGIMEGVELVEKIYEVCRHAIDVKFVLKYVNQQHCNGFHSFNLNSDCHWLSIVQSLIITIKLAFELIIFK